MVRNGVRVGVAACALGLSLAGPQALGVAGADSPDGDTPGVSKAQAQNRSERTGRDTARTTTPTERAPGATRASRTAREASATGSPIPRAGVARNRSAALADPAARRIPGVLGPAAAPAVPAAGAETPVEASGVSRSAPAAPPAPIAAQAVSVAGSVVEGILDTLAGWLSGLPPNPLSGFLEGALMLLRRVFLPPTVTDPDIVADPPNPATPSITIHNNSAQTLWIYNLPNSGDYSIPSDFQPVSITQGLSAPVTLALGTGAPGSPKNRIYIVEGTSGFTLPVQANSGVDAFNPTAPSEGNSFLNYSFVEYFLYPTASGNQYTIDVSYIDEWSLPVQTQFTLNGASWTGAVDGQIYGLKDFDTATSQLGATGAQPYGDLVWSGQSPWTPQPPSTVSRIIGPNRVWTAQSLEPESNWNMNNTGWVPSSYQNFVQYSVPAFPPCNSGCESTDYPYAFNGSGVSGSATETNFDFWKNEVTLPGSTPYPTALRTAAILDKFPADANGVYGFFTYPNDETAGQFTNIPTAVSLDMYVYGSADGLTDSVIPGGSWSYAGSVAATGTGPRIKNFRSTLPGTAATDTFILNFPFSSTAYAPRVQAVGEHNDIIVIDKVALGATSSTIDVVDRAWFLGGGLGNTRSQFVYERTTGNVYYDADPRLPGYTGVLANLLGVADPEGALYVL